MPDVRQQLIIKHAEEIRDGGADVVSVLAHFPDGQTRNIVLVMGSDKNLDPWADKRPVKKLKKHRGVL